MKRCLQLAELGKGRVAPNPMVGSVLVHNGHIIGEGWHKVYGGPHAEVNCLDSVQEEDKPFIKDSILYVSLEPCAHYGKTPPCSLRIIREGIKRVVIGMQDPFEKVNGYGIAQLRNAGVEVETGILEKDCAFLNRRFLTYYQKKRPYVHLKWAQTGDGYMASPPGMPRLMITNPMTARQVHQWRFEEGAVLVGTRTALEDDPLLDTRFWTKEPIKKIVIDNDLTLPKSLRLFNTGETVIVLNEKKNGEAAYIRYVKMDFSPDKTAAAILDALFALKIQSVLVEGGAATLNMFIAAGLWDEAHVLTNTKMKVGKGLKAPELAGCDVKESYNIDDDLISYYLKQ
jgi:diaminohydroxyphosphoribosylaminopyrimidine deaminase / 5-amino-6-(5-phosphoribosylamino)uracil reductase